MHIFTFFLVGNFCGVIYLTQGEKELSFPNHSSGPDKVDKNIWHHLNSLPSGKGAFAAFFGLKKSQATSARNLGAELEQANCQTLTTSVKLDIPPHDFDVIFYPTCVHLQRCTGCCYGDLLSCQPELVEDIIIKVMKIKTSQNTQSRGRGVDNLVEESSIMVKERNHLSCTCKCIVKEQDCLPAIQVYNEKQCSCECKNIKAEMECEKKYESHFWDLKKCSCNCREISECSSGFYFKQENCRCTKSRPTNSRVNFIDVNAVNG